jgi:Family of unknown function (DUF5990)
MSSAPSCCFPVQSESPVLIRIEGHDLPGASCGPGPDYPDGHPNIHVAVQRRNNPGELWGLVRGDAAGAEWELECTATESPSDVDLKGPFLQGGPGKRFVYLSWGVVAEAGAFTMFRRAKLMLDGVPPEVLRRAVDNGMLIGRMGLTDEKGHPRCAAVRPPLIDWTASPVVI